MVIYDDNNIIINNILSENRTFLSRICVYFIRIELSYVCIRIRGRLPPGNTSDEIQLAFVNRWIQAHIQDSDSILKKPILIGEFGKSYKYPGYSEQKRNSYFQKVYDAIYDCAKSKGPCGGGLFWQLMTQGMTNFGDGYEVVLESSPSTANIINQQSLRLAVLSSIT